MKKLLFLSLLISTGSVGQDRLRNQELSVNAFRNPSIGLEYRYHHFSVHAGYYPTNFDSGVTTSFIRTGISFWFLPVGNRPVPSSFYSSVSHARGLDREYEDMNAWIAEGGFRWMIWRGLNFRIGVAALMASGKDVEINPTPGISYSFTIN